MSDVVARAKKAESVVGDFFIVDPTKAVDVLDALAEFVLTHGELTAEVGRLRDNLADVREYLADIKDLPARDGPSWFCIVDDLLAILDGAQS